MGAAPERAMQNPEPTGSPVEMLVVACDLAIADGYANELRNQGQAAHLKATESLAGLERQLGSEPCDLVVVNAESPDLQVIQVIARVRASNPSASIILVGKDLAKMRELAIEHGLQDAVDFEDPAHLAFAVRREHHTQMLLREIGDLRRRLGETADRNDLLVQSSRDAIAYIHEGMYLSSNQAYLELFGYESAEELEGLPIMDMIDAGSRANFKAALRKINETGKHDEEFLCVTGSGETFTARMEFFPASIDGELCTQVVIRDEGDNEDLEKRIEELTNKDAQTGFLSRQSFMEHLDALMASPQGVEKSHALVQLSITNYPQIRETCGFGCAEQMLIEAAGVLAEALSDDRTVARFGDHDFMILCGEDEPALEVAERCLQRLRQHSYKSLEKALVQPVYSVGVTRTEKGVEISTHELINRSCRATGMAREDGENQIIFYNEQVPGETGHLAEADAALVKMIDNALANDGFRLKYQPIVSLQGDTRENYSVYLRLVDEQGNELEPEAFMSPAADARRLAEVDRWVVRNAIRELANHRRDGKKIIFYIIISRAGIEDDSMLLWICDCLREFRAKGSWLVFQFRENDLRHAVQPAHDLIAGLKKINCQIAVNNYTGGEPSDNLLKHLEVDVVKLSPDFMQGLATEMGAQDRMGEANKRLQEAGYKTIASGVEDANSLAILWNIGVNYIQGYFLQEPSNTITFEGEQEEHA